MLEIEKGRQTHDGVHQSWRWRLAHNGSGAWSGVGVGRKYPPAKYQKFWSVLHIFKGGYETCCKNLNDSHMENMVELFFCTLCSIWQLLRSLRILVVPYKYNLTPPSRKGFIQETKTSTQSQFYIHTLQISNCTQAAPSKIQIKRPQLCLLAARCLKPCSSVPPGHARHAVVILRLRSRSRPPSIEARSRTSTRGGWLTPYRSSIKMQINRMKMQMMSQRMHYVFLTDCCTMQSNEV